MDDQIKITKTGNSEVIIKKSRFLGMAVNAETEEEVKELLSDVRKEHYSARHVCYAYSLGEKNPKLKFSDDGEPGGTAGKPMLDVITKSGICNILIIVVRYFGGTLLGTGGLVRAYTQAAAEAIENAEKKTVCLSNTYEIQTDYTDFEKIRFILESTEGVTYEAEYSDKVILKVTVPEVKATQLTDLVTEKTSGRADVVFKDQMVI